ncbi:MAG TPA: hypothetical protein ENJ52_13205 [Aliiroseovarius sp.]|nr:hypothetical protein [Aliiroseovarius sp.]
MTYRQAILTLGLGISAILMASSQLRGQDRAAGNCGDRDEIVAALTEQYGETRQAIALTHARQVVELFAAADGGSWTLIITFPSGQTCLISAGDGIELTPDLTPPGDPA